MDEYEMIGDYLDMMFEDSISGYVEDFDLNELREIPDWNVYDSSTEAG